VWLVDDDLILYDNVVGSDWVDPQQTICAYVTACLRDMGLGPAVPHQPHHRRHRGRDRQQHGPLLLERRLRRRARAPGRLLPGVGTVYTTANNWLSVQDLFPDQVDGSIVRLDSPGRALPECPERRPPPRASTGTAIDDALAARIHVAAQVKAGGPGSATVGAIDTATATSFVLYVNLRQHNKSWIEQVPGIAAVVATLQTRGHRRVTLLPRRLP
jgi:hypothetical protein